MTTFKLSDGDLLILRTEAERFGVSTPSELLRIAITQAYYGGLDFIPAHDLKDTRHFCLRLSDDTARQLKTLAEERKCNRSRILRGIVQAIAIGQTLLLRKEVC